LTEINDTGYPGVSIILVNYNGLEDTIECVKSIQNSTYKNFDIIIVDNGSQNTNKVLNNSYLKSKSIVVSTGNNLGFSGGNNYGIKYAITHTNNDLILLLNNDTVVDKEFLNIMVHTYVKEDKPLLLTSKIMYYFNKNIIWYAGGKINEWKGTAYHEHNMEQDHAVNSNISKTDFITGCVLMFDRKTFELIGPLSMKYFLYCEDTDYSFRAKNKNVLMLFQPNAIVYHKVSASTNKISDKKAYYLYRNRLICIRENLTGIKKITAYIYSYLVIFKAIIYKKVTLRTAIKAIKDFTIRIEGKYSYERNRNL
jgi:GT2 family glycosyltransferase